MDIIIHILDPSLQESSNIIYASSTETCRLAWCPTCAKNLRRLLLVVRQCYWPAYCQKASHECWGCSLLPLTPNS